MITNSKKIYFLLILFLFGNMFIGAYFMTEAVFMVTGANGILILILLIYHDYNDTVALKGLALAHLKLSQRYLDMINLDFERRHSLNISLEDPINEKEKIYLMLMTISDNVLCWPPDKSSRWLGYCQYYMINKGYTTVNKERDYSRPLFHDAYNKLGYNIPKTIKI